MSASELRQPLQGVRNIIRFNWPYYAAAVAVPIGALTLAIFVPGPLRLVIIIVAAIAILISALSLGVSLYVYDLSGFYKLDWLDGIDPKHVLTLSAGFDETTPLLARKFPNGEITVCDFYNPDRNTEPSIRRARSAYPLSSGAVLIQGNRLPFDSESYDLILAIMSAHEMRDDISRIDLLREMRRCVTPDGEIVIVEHLRDAANLVAYNLGAFHFHSRSTWLANFRDAGLTVAIERKLNPWITTFSLQSNGTQY